jgi:hypothetical protein
VDTNNLPPGTLFVLQIQNSHIQIDPRTLNPRQIIARIRQNADRRVHVDHHPLNRSTLRKKEDHHGDAFHRILWHGYVIFSYPLAATSSR